MLWFRLMDDIDAPLPIALRDEVVDAIVGGTCHAYAVVADRHDQEEGFDGQTFGFNVYRTSWHHIEHQLDDVPDAHHARPNHSLRIVADGYAISGVYRGGDRPNYNVSNFDFEAGTPTRSQAPHHNMQLLLFGEEDEVAVRTAEVAQELTVVHCGNPEDGCTEIFVGAAVFNVDLGRSRWEWVRRIYCADLEVLADRPSTPDTPSPYPGYDEIPEPSVSVEKRPAEPIKRGMDD